jgi:hypothetical protein
MFVFIYKWRKKWRFLHRSEVAVVKHARSRHVEVDPARQRILILVVAHAALALAPVVVPTPPNIV